MAKLLVAAPAAGVPARVSYRVAEGVTHINGRKVVAATVELTPAEALYDLALGRLIDSAVKPVAGNGDGGN